MILIAKVASVTSETRATQVVQSVPADGEPSQRTGETFTCRIWVKDALVKLHNSGAIFLPSDICMATIRYNYGYWANRLFRYH
jgi:hypothetical protein